MTAIAYHILFVFRNRPYEHISARELSASDTGEKSETLAGDVQTDAVQVAADAVKRPPEVGRLVM